MYTVAKFGGSSVASAEQFAKVKDIVLSDSKRSCVVVSASGKRFPADNKITDLLLLVDAHVQYGVDCSSLLADIEQRFVEIAQRLDLAFDVHSAFVDLANQLQLGREYIVSRGEWITAQLMAEYLGYTFVDSADVIHFSFDGRVDMDATKESIQEAMITHRQIVIPGFYGALPDGRIRLFQRGGGDITGALVARALAADIYENWTDVSGFLSADPRIVTEPLSINRITFDEMRELSYMGASVLQEEAIFPVKEVGIPIQIKNTNRPSDAGTVIAEEVRDEADEHLITGIAGKRDFMSLHIRKAHMSSEIGLIRKALSIFERFHISVEHIPTGVDSFGVVVAQADIKDQLHLVMSALHEELQADDITIADDIALLCVVGRNMSRRSGTSGKIFGVLGEAGINIRMITQSSQEISIILGVSNADFERAITLIYDRFVSDQYNERA